MLSRTSPLVDPVWKEGHPPRVANKSVGGDLHGTVISQTRKYLKVSFEGEIVGLENDKWR